MRLNSLRVGIILAFAGILGACSETRDEPALADEEEVTPDTREAEEEHVELAEDLEEVIHEVAESVGEIVGEWRPEEPAHLEDMMELLPSRINGLERVTTESQGVQFFPGTADVSATYAGDDIEISLEITDPGALTPLIRSATEWLDQEVDQESSRGFERTRKFRYRATDYPAFESYSRTNDYATCSIVILVADRFLVTVRASGTEVEIEDCTDARDKLSYRKLERLAQKVEAE